jgi:hypothetical protein
MGVMHCRDAFQVSMWIIIGRCQLLLSALIIASTKMPQYQNSDRICQEAIEVFER